MTSWIVGLLISDFNHRILAGTAIFRFHTDYVNSLKSHQFYVVLHNL
jgi:hypothetical protein